MASFRLGSLFKTRAAHANRNSIHILLGYRRSRKNVHSLWKVYKNIKLCIRQDSQTDARKNGIYSRQTPIMNGLFPC